MITPVAALYITSVSVETAVFILILIKTIYQPRKVGCVLSAFSILTLPASIVNVLSYIDIVPIHWNSFAYLASTLFMLAIHFWLTLDIGKHLRVGGIRYNCPYVVAGAVGLGVATICIITQIVLLLVRNDPYPMRPVFVTGVCLAIVSDGCAYIYSFSSLIHFKSQRVHEGQSRTTALGVWFLLIQLIWYLVYGVLYIWFFCSTWERFSILLVFDYLARFALCLMFTWPPPTFVISYMTGQFFSGLSGNENDHQDDNASTFAITEAKKNNISFGHDETTKNTQDSNIDDMESAKEDIFYSSNVAIVMKAQ